MTRDDIKELKEILNPASVKALAADCAGLLSESETVLVECKNPLVPAHFIKVEIDENDIYSEVAQMLKKGIGWRPDDYLVPSTHEHEQRIASLYLALRIAIADAIESPTPANQMAVGGIVERLAVETLREQALDRVCARRGL